MHARQRILPEALRLFSQRGYETKHPASKEQPFYLKEEKMMKLLSRVSTVLYMVKT